MDTQSSPLPPRDRPPFDQADSATGAPTAAAHHLLSPLERVKLLNSPTAADKFRDSVAEALAKKDRATLDYCEGIVRKAVGK
jgi:hypothetical protein